MARSGIEGERDAQRLRFSEPDLKVVIGSGDDAATLWYHSATLASKSRYVDTMLSTPMREREERSITFPDIEPETWERMMKYLDSPVEVRGMNASDAFDLAALYDRYEFRGGTALCDEVLVEYFGKTNDMERDTSIDVNFVIDLVVLAHEANLIETQKAGLKYVLAKMKSEDTPYGMLMFNEDQLKRLAPHVQRGNLQRLGLREHGGYPIYWQSDQPDFAANFLTKATQTYEGNLLHRCIESLVLSGTRCGADGEFMSDEGEDGYSTSPVPAVYWSRFRTQSFWIRTWDASREAKFRISKENGCWTIFAASRVEGGIESCWIAPHSQNMSIPPQNGWIVAPSLNQLTWGNPTIRYKLRDHI